MSSTWRSEITAVLGKELRSEIRSKSGIVTNIVFGLVTVVTVSLSTYNQQIDKDIAASLLWVIILFASILSLPRVFLLEEEQNTADLLRLMGRPEAIFWGKALFNLIQILVTALIISFLFFGFTHSPLTVPWLYVVSLFGGCASLAGTVTLCGALVSRSTNRSTLAGVIAIPLLLFLVEMGVSGMRVAIGPFETDLVLGGGIRAGIGLVAYAVMTFAVGPPLYAQVWKS